MSSAVPQGAPVRPGGDGRDARNLAALLRWRARWLHRALPPRLAQAARLFPVLLHAGFERRGRRDAPPGVNGMRYRIGWSRLARAFDLPPFSHAQRGVCLVQAVLGLPLPRGLRLLLVVDGLRRPERRTVEDRVEEARRVLGSARAAIHASIVDVALLREPELAAQVLLQGALLGGRLEPPSWRALEEGSRRGIDARGLATLAAHAPTPMAELALTLLAGARPLGPLEVLEPLLRGGEPARLLADPSASCARWAAQVPRLRELMDAALKATRPAGPAAQDGDLAFLVRLGRRLVLASALAVRGSRVSPGDAAGRRFREQALGSEVPRVLLPVLARRLERADVGGIDLAPVPVGNAFQVRLPDGTALGHGSSPVQARVRALALLAAAGAEALLAGLEGPWAAVARRLARPPRRPTLFLLVEPAAAGGGPPFDPLNRGPRREIAFAGALAVTLAPGKRPSARLLGAEEAVVAAMRRAAGGTAVDVAAASGAARPAAARILQVAELVRSSPTRVPRAIEVGGRVAVPRGGRLSWYARSRFLARPRTFAADPDAPDLTLTPGHRTDPRWGGGHVIQCRVLLRDADTAAVLYADAGRCQLEELVAVREVEDHLRRARDLLKGGDPLAALAVRLSDDVEPAVRRAGPAPPAVEVSVHGALPFGLEIQVGEERYRGPGRWSGAAQVLLSRWPPGAEWRVAVAAMKVQVGGAPASGVLALYVRSAVLRRLRAQIERTAGSYRVARRSRRTG